MLTEKDLDQIRAIVREEIRTAGYGPIITCTPYLDSDTRASLERMAAIDRRNDERIAEWQTRKEEKS